ncbi:MAG: hypothetical protein CMJ49_05380 [Planctomycetaceae bacterium]|nr:hypothetical protein [Planctomycetaceae bacterium]
MGHALLWIESLAAAVLFVALCVAWIARLRRAWMRIMLSFVPSIVPLLLPGALVLVLMGFETWIGLRWTVIGGSLVLAYLVGAGIVIVRGLQRSAAEQPPRANAWPRIKLLVACLVAAALTLTTFWNLDTAAKIRLSAVQAEAGALALSVAPPRIPDRDNAAFVYEQAFALISKPSDGWDAWDAEDGSLDAAHPELRTLLDQNESALALLRRAAAMPDCYFDRDWGRPSYDILLPELAQFRGAAQLLCLDARYQAWQGNTSTSLADLSATILMARHIERGPLLITNLVALAVEGHAIETLRALVRSADLTGDDLASIDLGGNLDVRRSMRRVFRSEMALGLGMFAQLGDEEAMLNIYGSGGMPAPWVVALYRVCLLDKDLETYRAPFETLNDITTLSYSDARAKWEATVLDTDVPEAVMAKQLGLIPHRAIEIMLAGGARHDVARLAVAAARYRADHGVYPEKLPALTPDYINTILVDPFDDKPLKVTVTDEHVVIYSVGVNMMDEEGTAPEPDDPLCREGGDIAIRLPR